MTEPEFCDKCDRSLAKEGCVTFFEGDQPKRSICPGCHLREQLRAFRTDGRLRMNLLNEGAVAALLGAAQYRGVLHVPDEAAPLHQLGEELHQLAYRVEAEVWFGRGLAKFVRPQKTRGNRLNLSDGAVLLTYSMAGRCRLSLQTKDEDHFTIQCDESSDTPPTMGVVGVDAKLETCRALVDKVCREFNVANVRVDDKISVF